MPNALLRRTAVVPVAALAILGGLVAPAAAAPSTQLLASSQRAQPQAPYGSCGSHFSLSRNGSTVRVVGTDLYVFSRDYMLVYASANGRSNGPYTGSPNSGANFTFDSGSPSQTNVGITLTNSNNTATLCTGSYYG